jgi:hypothetical protein
MIQPAAPASRVIKVVTWLFFVLNAGFYVIGSWLPLFWVIAGAMTLTAVATYLLWTPVSYELARGELIIHFRIGRKRYGPVVRCAPIGRPRGGVRLFGVGGLFATSGIFWSRELGVFRAYITSTEPAGFVLVETGKTRVVISPRDTGGFVVARP